MNDELAPGPVEHPEPWIIALSQPPSVHRAFDYGLRWGIEAMFSDLKTRGFNLEDSQIARTDRLDRLVLVLALSRCAQAGQRMRAVIPSFDRI